METQKHEVYVQHKGVFVVAMCETCGEVERHRVWGSSLECTAKQAAQRDAFGHAQRLFQDTTIRRIR